MISFAMLRETSKSMVVIIYILISSMVGPENAGCNLLCFSVQLFSIFHTCLNVCSHIWSSTRQNQSSGFPTKGDSNQSRKLKFRL